MEDLISFKPIVGLLTIIVSGTYCFHSRYPLYLTHENHNVHAQVWD